MPLVPTVKVVKEDSDRGYMIIAEEDYDPDDHTLYGDETLSAQSEDESDEEESSGEITYEASGSGWYTIYEGSEEVDTVRGREALEEALSEYQ